MMIRIITQQYTIHMIIGMSMGEHHRHHPPSLAANFGGYERVALK